MAGNCRRNYSCRQHLASPNSTVSANSDARVRRRCAVAAGLHDECVDQVLVAQALAGSECRMLALRMLCPSRGLGVHSLADPSRPGRDKASIECNVPAGVGFCGVCSSCRAIRLSRNCSIALHLNFGSFRLDVSVAPVVPNADGLGERVNRIVRELPIVQQVSS